MYLLSIRDLILPKFLCIIYIMKKIVTGLIVFIITFICLFASACGNGGWAQAYFTYFNTNVTITLKDANLNAQTKNKIESALKTIEDELSTDKTSSCVYNFNNATTGQLVTMTDTALLLIQTAKDFDTHFPNKFSPAVYPLVDLWQFTPEKYNETFILPSEDDILTTKNLCDLDLINIDTENNTASKTTDGVKLDFGGIAKGYALTQITDLLKPQNISMGYVNLGGSSIYVYGVPDYLGISHPRKNTEIIRVMPSVVKNAFIGTSGDYQKYHIVGEKRYSHIIDLTTGSPADTGFTSVTVVCNDGAFSDMLSTALMCFTYDEMTSLLSNTALEFDVFAIYDKDGKKEVLTNKKQGEDFTLLDSEFVVKSF